ncbi:MAG: hypothetical protein LBJ39_04725 [Tannerellaceae bacterium]|nr:hypothetical protein [Tannerellaceae bacterium]
MLKSTGWRLLHSSAISNEHWLVIAAHLRNLQEHWLDVAALLRNLQGVLVETCCTPPQPSRSTGWRLLHSSATSRSTG